MPDIVSGVLKTMPKGGGFLRDPARSFRPGEGDVWVPPPLIRDLGLVEGATVTGTAQRGDRGLRLQGVQDVCGLPPAEFAKRPHFKDLVALDPDDRLDLGAAGDVSMRVVDLVSPIGRGTRGLIVSPPKAGKTILLEKMAQGIRAARPEARIVILLVDERPEEVTHFRRTVDAEVLASTNDQSVRQHLELVELTIARVRVELECGRDQILLVDSLTRLGRAFNVRGSGTGRTMSGGLEAGAMEIPRHFFGLARKIENGGSVTIVATCLVDTGSRMDELIFQEFKGTGNSEIILDRGIAEARIFPAINISASGTRKEERLYGPQDAPRLARLRRMLADLNPREAVEMLIRLVEKHPDNRALLQAVPMG